MDQSKIHPIYRCIGVRVPLDVQLDAQEMSDKCCAASLERCVGGVLNAENAECANIPRVGLLKGGCLYDPRGLVFRGGLPLDVFSLKVPL